MMSCPSIYKVSYKVKIMISNAVTLAGTVLIAAMAAAPAHATPVTDTHEYGTHASRVAPMRGGKGNITINLVNVTEYPDSEGNHFYDALTFDTADFGTIHSLTLTLAITNARDSNEDWRVYGSTNGGHGIDDGKQIGERLIGPASWSYVLSSGDVFKQATKTGSLGFWFEQKGKPGSYPYEFRLHSASLTVDGAAPDPGPAPAPIPLPAAGLLLIGSLGGFVLLRRRGSG